MSHARRHCGSCARSRGLGHRSSRLRRAKHLARSPAAGYEDRARPPRGPPRAPSRRVRSLPIAELGDHRAVVVPQREHDERLRACQVEWREQRLVRTCEGTRRSVQCEARVLIELGTDLDLRPGVEWNNSSDPSLLTSVRRSCFWIRHIIENKQAAPLLSPAAGHRDDFAATGAPPDKSMPETLTIACHAASWLVRS